MTLTDRQGLNDYNLFSGIVAKAALIQFGKVRWFGSEHDED